MPANLQMGGNGEKKLHMMLEEKLAHLELVLIYDK